MTALCWAGARGHHLISDLMIQSAAESYQNPEGEDHVSGCSRHNRKRQAKQVLEALNSRDDLGSNPARLARHHGHLLLHFQLTMNEMFG